MNSTDFKFLIGTINIKFGKAIIFFAIIGENIFPR